MIFDVLLEMKYLFHIFKSKYCLGVFILSLILSYFLIPKKVFYGIYTLLAVVFMISFFLTISCMVRNIKERIIIAKTYTSSLVGIIATAVGLAAMQVCGFGAPVCGAAVGLGIFSSLFPVAFVDVMSKYAVGFVTVSILIQVVALYFMNCFNEFNRVNLSVKLKRA